MDESSKQPTTRNRDGTTGRFGTAPAGAQPSAPGPVTSPAGPTQERATPDVPEQTQPAGPTRERDDWDEFWEEDFLGLEDA